MTENRLDKILNETRDAIRDDTATRGTYELLRDRLLGHAAELRTRADQLNADRLEAFGRSTFEVAGTPAPRSRQAWLPTHACDQQISS